VQNDDLENEKTCFLVFEVISKIRKRVFYFQGYLENEKTSFLLLEVVLQVNDGMCASL